MEIAEAINDEILRLWYQPAHRLADRQPRMPRVYPPLKVGGPLFIGLNPSFSKKAFREFLHDDEWKSFDPATFYAWRDSPSDFELERACRIEQLALDRYSHYTHFSGLAARLETHWNYVDVFLLRETKDKHVRPQVTKGGAAGWRLAGLNPFGRAQVDLCIKLIEKLEPRLLVVANAAASRILEDALAATFDVTLGYHRVTIAGRSVPAFFSSMWTGQRALDVFSRRRLQWQIEVTFRAQS